MRKRAKLLIGTATLAVFAAGAVTVPALVNPRPAGPPPPTPREALAALPRPDAGLVEGRIRAKDWTALREGMLNPRKADDVIGQMIRFVDSQSPDDDTKAKFYGLAKDLLASKPSSPRPVVLCTTLLGKLGPTEARLKELRPLYAKAQGPAAAARSWLEIAVFAPKLPAEASKTLRSMLESKNAGEVREGLFLLSRVRDESARANLEKKVIGGYFRAPAAAQPYLYNEIFSRFRNAPPARDADKMKNHARTQTSEIWNEVRRTHP